MSHNFPELTFTDYESYVSWMQKWKNSYGLLSQEIREQKAQIRAAQQVEDVNTAAILMYRRWQNRCLASSMLERRRQSKVLSWQMKLATRLK